MMTTGASSRRCQIMGKRECESKRFGAIGTGAGFDIKSGVL
jgi:hypothetical protein